MPETPALRLLVTRPREQATSWVLALRDVGVDAQALPLIEIAPPRDAAPVIEAWRALPSAALVMFVSANAVHHFFAARPAGADWPTSTLAGSTGGGTAVALRRAGVSADLIVQPRPGQPQDSESLWQVLSTSAWAGRRVVIVRGEDGRDWLADRLRAAGATVNLVIAYRRQAPRLSPPERALLRQAQAEPGRHLWLFSSSEALRHLQALQPTGPGPQATALCTHARIAQAAQAAGFAHVRLVEPAHNAPAQALAEVVASLQSALP